jgi:inosine-uridine nucleoside N-ribohydrolase
MEQDYKEKWIIDTDPGCDYMMAILYMLSIKITDILLITTIDGNVCLDKTTHNAQKLMKWTGMKIPIHRGSPNPILKIYENLESYHCEDGFGDIDEIQKVEAKDIKIEDEPSSVKMVEYILKYPGKVNLLLLGPLTNIATAYMLEPKIKDFVKSVYIMGGSLLSRGNQNCPGEFNFAYDFIAAKIILSNFKNVILTPWEPTEVVYVTSQVMEKISKSFCVESESYNKHLFYYSSLIVDKYTTTRRGIQFCDMYSAITAYNGECVSNYSLCQLDISIDSHAMFGMVITKNKIKFNEEFNSFMKSEKYKKKGENYHVVIESFDQEKIYNLLRNLFVC